MEKTTKIQQLFLKKTFKIFLNTTLYSSTSPLNVHYSFKNLFIQNSNKGLLVLSVTRLFSIYINIYTYLYNLNYYNLNTFFFGTVFFKNEVHALNTLTLNTLKLNLRLNKLLLFLKPLLRNTQNQNLLKILIPSKISNAVIFDIFYHRNTINYLQKLSIFTLGVVPITYNIRTVDLSIPITVDSIFSIQFVLKLINTLKKASENAKYKNKLTL